MPEEESTEERLLSTDIRRDFNPGYEPRCAECDWTGGVYLLGPVALKHALGHTEYTHHRVRVFEGVG